jgi:hypothetical protein
MKACGQVRDQYTGSKRQCGPGSPRALSTCSTKSRTRHFAAPSDARWRVFCWQSMHRRRAGGTGSPARRARSWRRRAAREHRFAEHRAADGHAVQAAREFAVDPGLDAVRMPGPVQRLVGLAPWPARSRCPTGRRAGCPQARITVSKAWSKRISQRASARKPAASCAASGAAGTRPVNSTMRGSVLHQRMGWPSLNQGKMPWL